MSKTSLGKSIILMIIALLFLGLTGCGLFEDDVKIVDEEQSTSMMVEELRSNYIGLFDVRRADVRITFQDLEAGTLFFSTDDGRILPEEVTFSGGEVLVEDLYTDVHVDTLLITVDDASGQRVAESVLDLRPLDREEELAMQDAGADFPASFGLLIQDEYWDFFGELPHWIFFTDDYIKEMNELQRWDLLFHLRDNREKSFYLDYRGKEEDLLKYSVWDYFKVHGTENWEKETSDLNDLYEDLEEVFPVVKGDILSGDWPTEMPDNRDYGAYLFRDARMGHWQSFYTWEITDFAVVWLNEESDRNIEEVWSLNGETERNITAEVELGTDKDQVRFDYLFAICNVDGTNHVSPLYVEWDDDEYDNTTPDTYNLVGHVNIPGEAPVDPFPGYPGYWSPENYSITLEVTVNPDPPHTIILDGPEEVDAGAPSDDFTLTVIDDYDNPTPVESDTVFKLSTNTGEGTFAGEHVNGDELTIPEGVSTVTFTYSNTLASSDHEISVERDSGDELAGGEDATHSINVNPLHSSQIELSGPAEVVAGAASDNFTLEVQDEYGNVTVVSEDTVFALTTDKEEDTSKFNDGEIGEPGQATVSEGESSATFTYYNTVASEDHLITATYVSGDSGLSGASDDVTIDVVVGGPHSLEIVLPEDGYMAGEMSSEITLNIKDLAENLTGVSGETKIQLETDQEDPEHRFEGIDVEEEGDDFIITFQENEDSKEFTFYTELAGDHTIRAFVVQFDPVDEDLEDVSDNVTITVYPNVADSGEASAVSPQTAGEGFDITITLSDEYGNRLLDGEFDVTIESDEEDDTLFSEESIRFEDGDATIEVTLHKATEHNLTITVDDEEIDEVEIDLGINVNPGLAEEVNVTGPETIIMPGRYDDLAEIQYEADAHDGSGNEIEGPDITWSIIGRAEGITDEDVFISDTGIVTVKNSLLDEDGNEDISDAFTVMARVDDTDSDPTVVDLVLDDPEFVIETELANPTFKRPNQLFRIRMEVDDKDQYYNDRDEFLIRDIRVDSDEEEQARLYDAEHVIEDVNLIEIETLHLPGRHFLTTQLVSAGFEPHSITVDAFEASLEPGTDPGTTKLVDVTNDMEYNVNHGDWIEVGEGGESIDNIQVEEEDQIRVRIKDGVKGEPAGPAQLLNVEEDDISDSPQ